MANGFARVFPDPTRRNYEFFPNMVESVAHDSQTPPLELDDGIIIDRRVPSGSVARGYLPLPFPATPEGALLAGQALQNPIPDDDGEALTRGARHGDAGLFVPKRLIRSAEFIALRKKLRIRVDDQVIVRDTATTR